jgi:hypothetical protein
VLFFLAQGFEKMDVKMNVKTVTNNPHRTTDYPDIDFRSYMVVGNSAGIAGNQ